MIFYLQCKLKPDLLSLLHPVTQLCTTTTASQDTAKLILELSIPAISSTEGNKHKSPIFFMKKMLAVHQCSAESYCLDLVKFDPFKERATEFSRYLFCKVNLQMETTKCWTLYVKDSHKHSGIYYFTMPHYHGKISLLVVICS